MSISDQSAAFAEGLAYLGTLKSWNFEKQKNEDIKITELRDGETKPADPVRVFANYIVGPSAELRKSIATGQPPQLKKGQLNSFDEFFANDPEKATSFLVALVNAASSRQRFMGQCAPDPRTQELAGLAVTALAIDDRLTAFMNRLKEGGDATRHLAAEALASYATVNPEAAYDFLKTFINKGGEDFDFAASLLAVPEARIIWKLTNAGIPGPAPIAPGSVTEQNIAAARERAFSLILVDIASMTREQTKGALSAPDAIPALAQCGYADQVIALMAAKNLTLKDITGIPTGAGWQEGVWAAMKKGDPVEADRVIESLGAPPAERLTKQFAFSSIWYLQRDGRQALAKSAPEGTALADRPEPIAA